ncbi:MAG: elongation factor Ts [Oscillospiraceae bacterium]|nr:elongation factor Ts [Candidatus Equicaccousia limihippi]
MEFTAKDVQALREKTGCGMMDCKKALTETNGDMDAAVDFLREKGLAQQAKKAGRIAAEGVVLAEVYGNVGVVVELNAETDFVANSDKFRDLTAKIAKIIADQNPADVDTLLACTENGVNVADMIQEVFLAVRENIKVRRFARYEGVVASYVHAGGKIGVLVKFDADEAVLANNTFKAMSKDVAMQIAAAMPSYLNRESVPAEVLEKEKSILVSQMKEDPKMANKPEAVLEKIVAGKIGKYYSENCLVDQAFVKDDSLTVGKYVEAKAKEIGSAVSIADFVRFEKGEGIEKRQDNFAEEIANMVK